MGIELLSTDIKGTPCSECKAFSFSITSSLLEGYFYNKEIKCPKCGAKLDLWNSLMRHFQWEFPSYLFAVVGGNNTWSKINMKPNETVVINLQDLGIPADAKILQISYTPQGGSLFPVELHGNVPNRHFIPTRIHLFGKPNGESVENTIVLVVIDWVPKNEENEVWHNLIEAIESFSQYKYHLTIIPANVSVEAKLNFILFKYLTRIASKKRVSDFLSNGATYSHQLNILLPLLADFEKFPLMPDFLRGYLNELRDYRNEFAHQGKYSKDIDKSTTARLLCSATFGLAYLNIFENKLQLTYKD
jgi:hypothetical protein